MDLGHGLIPRIDARNYKAVERCLMRAGLGEGESFVYSSKVKSHEPRGQLLCRLPCCASGQPVESTPSRGREHSLHARVAEARQLSSATGSTAIGQVVRMLEQRKSVARSIAAALHAADLPLLSTEFIETHLAVARWFSDAISEVA